jgi:hypothetical protein
MSLLKREAKASPAAETSRRARLVEFVKSSGRKLEAALGTVKWFNEILALLKLLNDLPEGCIDPSGTALPHITCVLKSFQCHSCCRRAQAQSSTLFANGALP